MEKCPSLQDWLDLNDGRTTTERAAQLHAHLATGCTACAAQQAWLGRALAALSQVTAPGLAEPTRQVLRELAAARLAAEARPLWIATLLRDTRRQQVVGARGSDEGIQLRYDAGDHEIRLWAEASASATWYVIGQVYNRVTGVFLVPEAAALIHAEGTVQAARTEDSEFHFDAIPVGSYRLAIQLADTELLVPELKLEQE